MRGALVAALTGSALVLGSGAARADELTLSVQPTTAVMLGYDSNARRVPQRGPSGARPCPDIPIRDYDTLTPDVVGDGLLIARAGAIAQAASSGFSLRADGTVGAKLFFDTTKPSPDTPYWGCERARTRTDAARMLVMQGSATLTQNLPAGFRSQLDVYGKGRAQANVQRTYGLTQSRWSLSRGLPFGLQARGGLTGLYFHSVDTPLFSFSGGGLHGGARWYMTTRESLDLDLGASLRAYPFFDPDTTDGDIQERRVDVPLRATLSFTSVRRIFVSAGYNVMRNASNTIGQSYTRHRLFGMTGFRLPAQVTASLRGTLQITQYDQGISLEQQFFVQDTDESQNSFSLGLSRPWAFGSTLEARLAWYGNELTKGVSQFSRTTAEVGVRMDL